jgi:heptose I phosphotransferase
VQALERIGVDTLSVAAYTSTGRNPAAIQSLIVTDDLVGTVSLEDYCANWAAAPPDPRVRMRLILKLADSARRMHGAGINHRDFYLCHFHLDESSLAEQSLRCYLIDLHRAQIRRHTPRRWRVKDLAGLYFSAMDCGLQRRDLWRFMRHYSEGGLRRALGEDARLWRQVERRARQLYRKGHGTEPPVIGAVGAQADA